MTDAPIPEFPPQMVPEGWDVEFMAPPVAIDDCVKVTLPSGAFWVFLKGNEDTSDLAPFIYALLASIARSSASAVELASLLHKVTR